MKESQITPEVIKLSKEIAEHWRMEIYRGCWCIIRWQTPVLISDESSVKWATGQKAIPIPSISDCESRLESLGWFCKSEREFPSMRHEVTLEFIPTSSRIPTLTKHRFVMDNHHEALLEALLSVLKKEKE